MKRITLVKDKKDYVIIPGQLRPEYVDLSIGEFITKMSPEGKVDVSLRPLKGARKVHFSSQATWSSSFGEFFSSRRNGELYLCREKTVKVLGVKKTTKSFDIWVRPVK